MLPDSRSDLQIAVHPSVNFPTEIGDEEAIPIHVNEPNHLQNSQHRSQCARGQSSAVATSILFCPDFLDEGIESDRLSMCSQDAEDERGCSRAREELYERILESLQVSCEPDRHLGPGGTGPCGPIDVAANELAANQEREGGNDERPDDN